VTSETPLSEFAGLLTQIENLLREHPEGLSEFELLKTLQAEPLNFFSGRMFQDNHAMFQAHFLLYHALYRLDDDLRRSSKEALEIHVLNIRLHDMHTDKPYMPATPDPLRAYYADLRNLRETSADDVEQMLGSFWVRYYANERRAEALSVLGLEDPVEMTTITKRYRQLAMEHHPDRGGEHRQFQRLQEAMSLLRRC
jgi:DnaJ-domain-containing protein 1